MEFFKRLKHRIFGADFYSINGYTKGVKIHIPFELDGVNYENLMDAAQEVYEDKNLPRVNRDIALKLLIGLLPALSHSYYLANFHDGGEQGKEEIRRLHGEISEELKALISELKAGVVYKDNVHISNRMYIRQIHNWLCTRMPVE